MTPPHVDGSREQATRTQTARKKLESLSALIHRADHAGLDTLKEKMTVRTAEVFLSYADWDEANKEINSQHFERAARYKQNAAEMAESLPDFERRDIITMLEEATTFLDDLIAGNVVRRPTPDVDWANVSHDGDQLTFQGRPVFLTDWTWKPEMDELNEYHGAQDGFFLMHPYVINRSGEILPRIARELDTKPSGRLGFIFLNHKNAPQWAARDYGSGFVMRQDTYTAYDIDHPGAREMNRLLLSGTIPKMAGKKYTELGYMLCNEPHFFTTEGVWATGPVSNYTMDKFRRWLEEKHRTIERLNGLWETHFANFAEVTLAMPIAAQRQGTPPWYDWVSFNRDRVTDWYAFLKGEIRKHDPAAKVHLKIIPNLWTDNARNHGIDFESLTRMSEIIGNDAGASYSPMWGEADWQDHYAFEWREMSMGHDFQKSVSPRKIMYNTESHFLSTVRSRDLHMDPAYARATFWLAHTQGLTVSQNWFWARREDGSIRKGLVKGYAGSNNQQPRVVNEVHSTLMDLNAHAEEIMAMQRQARPIRIFYSEASATNKAKHMDDVFELYESLFFEGVPLGFVTQDILTRQSHEDWDTLLVHQTPFVTRQDFASIQDYVAGGGHVILDDVSLSKDEYGRDLPKLADLPNIRRVKSLDEMKTAALRFLKLKGHAPAVIVKEQSDGERKGCTWKCVENRAGNPVLSIVNVGKHRATLTLTLRNGNAGTRCQDLLTGKSVSSNPTLRPYEVLFVELTPFPSQPSTP
ncbi:alpha-amylase family protein [Novipirellula artificiosorum]|uniref:alpha-amylase family protein n=1 Tax=Novipirellula artificiosorum TaxID=2528016 RepID=UPI0018CE6791|nr:alpha-amylase family protein [Novipirellula artificiosorum]